MMASEVEQLENEIRERRQRLVELTQKVTLDDLRQMTAREIAQLPQEVVSRALRENTPAAASVTTRV
jgi:hypothetical protein